MGKVIDFHSVLGKTRDAAKVLATLPHAKRKATLRTLASVLQSSKKNIFDANKKDVAMARASGKNAAYIDRLTFTQKSFASMLAQVQDIAVSKEVLGRLLERKRIASGVRLVKVSVPLGVIGVIYESRPNVTIDVAALCIMSGNAAVLKGGSDALTTNRALNTCIQTALKRSGIPTAAVTFLDTKDRLIVDRLVKASGYVDVLIPRGGYELVKKVVKLSRIPILYHAEGGTRIFVDQSADIKKAVEICLNAKTNRPATCNSLDTVLVHKGIAKYFVPLLVHAFQASNVEVRGDARTVKLTKVKKATEKDYMTEFLDLTVAVRVVKGVDEAIELTNKYGKRHTEGIVSRDRKIVSQFVGSIDAAGIFVNCSTRLHDGGIFGLGAEMGVATGKLHARGPVGLRELTTYKWVAYGTGQLRT